VAEREEAVRYYLTSMFRSSLAESRGEPMTAKAMLDRSAQRVLETYRDEPRLAGKIVATLADLYGALEDVEGQVPLLEGFLAGAGSGADPEAVALARQKLANIELLRGHAERAGELLTQAEAFWESAPQRYREQRLEGMFYRGALLRARGDLAGSIRTYQSAIEDRTALSGHVHRETANLYNSLAISLTGAGRMNEALAAYRESIGIHESLGQGDDLDALVMLGNTGTLAYRTGRTVEAQGILQTAFTRQQQLAGDSAAVAASMGLYGSTLTVQGRFDEAVAVLKTAADMAVQFTGPGSPLSVQDRLFLVDALRAANERDAAHATLAETLTIAKEKFGESHILTLRAQLSGARLLLADGDAAAAESQLSGIIDSLRKPGPPAELQLAQALVCHGEALLLQSRNAQAVAPLTEAVALREKLLWSESWEIGEARARLGEALLPDGDPRAEGLLQQAVVALEQELGANHAQTRRAQNLLTSLAVNSTSSGN
jgi:non-specific serine/threonine protein kinase/serine/threonine-protein kinase